jgi:hypothetical protein
MFKLVIEKHSNIFIHKNCSFNFIFKSNRLPLYNNDGEELKIKINIKPSSELSIEIDVLNIEGDYNSLYIKLKQYKDLIDDSLYYSSCMHHFLFSQSDKRDNLNRFIDLMNLYLGKEINKEQAYNLLNLIKNET